MTAVLARLDPAVPLRYTVRHTNTHQTPTALALICHQVNVHKQEIKNAPHGYDRWEIDITDLNPKDERGGMVGNEPQMPRCEVHLPTLILWYDRNTYHYSDFKVTLKWPWTDGGRLGCCSD